MYIIYGETDHQPRLDAWDKCSGLVHWEDPEGWDGEGGGRGDQDVNPWLIHVNVWQKPLQYCKVISLQLIKINKKKKRNARDFVHWFCILPLNLFNSSNSFFFLMEYLGFSINEILLSATQRLFYFILSCLDIFSFSFLAWFFWIRLLLVCCLRVLLSIPVLFLILEVKLWAIHHWIWC